MSATGADASACASMNQVWNGKTGSLTAKAMKNSHAIKVAIAAGSTTSWSATISKVRTGALK